MAVEMKDQVIIVRIPYHWIVLLNRPRSKYYCWDTGIGIIDVCLGDFTWWLK